MMSTNINDANNELTHDKIQVEIAKLMAETARINNKSEKIQKEMKDSDTLTAKLQAEINESVARTAKMVKENQYYPLAIGSTVTLAIVAVTKRFL